MTTQTPIKRFYAPGPWITRELRECVQAKDYDALASELAAAQEWREAVLNELIVAHIYTKEHDTNPRKAIQDAITWNCQVALDPAVSSDAQKFIAAAQEALQRAEERAQAWRERTREAEDVALAALASFALTQSVDDYPQDHWAHRAERIRTIRAERIRTIRAAIYAGRTP